jgi:hypothetical protein
MADLFATGRIVDLILGLIVLEAVVLALWHRWTGKGVSSAGIIWFLMAGACLLLALRAALTGATWFWIALWLAAALAAHVADLHHRWRNLR